ncbi:Kinase, STE STE11 [Giardia muris]|uniref:Kinase, STE STE11 n=1 Tax=Giardia muris TaxID=5742 RepID=A0A4Z1SPT0_GIAMU|nr:Kinase, STE STE11 [Giardia muris]|eukprot:TNJ26885.1 Kinase, STE STE11 [Giardia muris]
MQLVHERYALHAVIGQGAFGKVWKAVDTQTGVFVALKQIERRDPTKTKTLEREFLRDAMTEINLMSELSHENIVRYLGCFVEQQGLYIVLELVDFGSLKSLLRQYMELSEKFIASCVCQILRGLEYLHGQGIVHKDIKAANILMTSTGTCKLSDFGLSQRLQDVDPSVVEGSPYWLAPEVLNEQGVSTRSDVWSLGATVIELLTTNPPFHDMNSFAAMFNISTLTEMPLPPNISPECASFLASCFRIEPKERPTCAELLRFPWISAHDPLQSQKGSSVPRPLTLEMVPPISEKLDPQDSEAKEAKEAKEAIDRDEATISFSSEDELEAVANDMVEGGLGGVCGDISTDTHTTVQLLTYLSDEALTKYSLDDAWKLAELISRDGRGLEPGPAATIFLNVLLGRHGLFALLRRAEFVLDAIRGDFCASAYAEVYNSISFHLDRLYSTMPITDKLLHDRLRVVRDRLQRGKPLSGGLVGGESFFTQRDSTHTTGTKTPKPLSASVPLRGHGATGLNPGFLLLNVGLPAQSRNYLALGSAQILIHSSALSLLDFERAKKVKGRESKVGLGQLRGAFWKEAASLYLYEYCRALIHLILLLGKASQQTLISLLASGLPYLLRKVLEFSLADPGRLLGLDEPTFLRDLRFAAEAELENARTKNGEASESVVATTATILQHLSAVHSCLYGDKPVERQRGAKSFLADVQSEIRRGKIAFRLPSRPGEGKESVCAATELTSRGSTTLACIPLQNGIDGGLTPRLLLLTSVESAENLTARGSAPTDLGAPAHSVSDDSPRDCYVETPREEESAVTLQSLMLDSAFALLRAVLETDFCAYSDAFSCGPTHYLICHSQMLPLIGSFIGFKDARYAIISIELISKLLRRQMEPLRLPDDEDYALQAARRTYDIGGSSRNVSPGGAPKASQVAIASLDLSSSPTIISDEQYMQLFLLDNTYDYLAKALNSLVFWDVLRPIYGDALQSASLYRIAAVGHGVDWSVPACSRSVAIDFSLEATARVRSVLVSPGGFETYGRLLVLNEWRLDAIERGVRAFCQLVDVDNRFEVIHQTVIRAYLNFVGVVALCLPDESQLPMGFPEGSLHQRLRNLVREMLRRVGRLVSVESFFDSVGQATTEALVGLLLEIVKSRADALTGHATEIIGKLVLRNACHCLALSKGLIPACYRLYYAFRDTPNLPATLQAKPIDIIFQTALLQPRRQYDMDGRHLRRGVVKYDRLISRIIDDFAAPDEGKHRQERVTLIFELSDTYAVKSLSLLSWLLDRQKDASSALRRQLSQIITSPRNLCLLAPLLAKNSAPEAAKALLRFMKQDERVPAYFATDRAFLQNLCGKLHATSEEITRRDCMTILEHVYAYSRRPRVVINAFDLPSLMCSIACEEGERPISMRARALLIAFQAFTVIN